MMKNKHNKAFQIIKKAKNILLCTHIKPDGDALGSLCAFTLFLDSEKITYNASVDSLSAQFNFLPGINKITTTPIQKNTYETIDTVIILDFNDFKRYFDPELLELLYKKNIPFIIFDHHFQFEKLEKALYLADDNASSTTTILCDFFINNSIEIDSDMATCLLTGILTDTGSFLNAAANKQSLNYSSSLLLKGARHNHINNHIVKNKKIPTLNLWGDLLSRLYYNAAYKIAYTIVLQQDLEKYNIDSESYEGLSNFLTCINDIHAVMVLIQMEDKTIKGSLRSIHPQANVAKIAKYLGGGGHIRAAGFKIEGTLIQKGNKWEVV